MAKSPSALKWSQLKKKRRAAVAKKRLKKDLGLSVSKEQAVKYGKVRKGAVGAEMTKGGAYVKYEKKSKAAGSFRSARRKGCKGEGGTFSWDGRSYSCATAEGNKKKAAAKEKAAAAKKKAIGYGKKGGLIGPAEESKKAGGPSPKLKKSYS